MILILLELAIAILEEMLGISMVLETQYYTNQTQTLAIEPLKPAHKLLI
jgi:hypothetical protein